LSSDQQQLYTSPHTSPTNNIFLKQRNTQTTQEGYSAGQQHSSPQTQDSEE
jgi:tetratricopeptide (TPR) repeat protein